MIHRSSPADYQIPFFSNNQIELILLPMAKVLTLIRKDILLELRQKHVIYGIFLYVASSIFVLFLSLKQPDAVVWNSLFWVLQLFIVVNAVAKSFLQDSKGRMLYYYSIASPVQIILAKIVYNFLLMLVLSTISILLFGFFLGTPYISFLRFAGIAILGGITISTTFTLLSAIAAKANNNAGLMAILGFPLLLPALMMLMKLSKHAFGEVFKAGAVAELVLLLLGLNVLLVGLSIILFPFLWKD
jgi:heme exporter protein B